jgi:hypothetical protein
MSDYVVWRKSAVSNIPLDNEVSSPGVTDQADFDTWRDNFGATMSQGNNLSGSVVPEPASHLLAFFGAIVWLVSDMTSARTRDRN